MNDKNNTARPGIGTIIGLFIILTILCSCSSSNDSYKKTLESGLSKYYSGEKMSNEEYNAVKGYNDWKDKQSSKKYSDWD